MQAYITITQQRCLSIFTLLEEKKPALLGRNKTGNCYDKVMRCICISWVEFKKKEEANSERCNTCMHNLLKRNIPKILTGDSSHRRQSRKRINTNCKYCITSFHTEFGYIVYDFITLRAHMFHTHMLFHFCFFLSKNNLLNRQPDDATYQKCTCCVTNNSWLNMQSEQESNKKHEKSYNS